MEDITSEFMERCGDFDKVFKDHIEKRSEYKSYLQDFDDDLQKLADIPILPPLIQGAEEQPCHAFDNLLLEDTKNSFTTSNLIGNRNDDENQASTSKDESNNVDQATFDSDKSGQMTLLQWISSNENQKTLKVMAESCNRELDMFEKNVMDSLKDDIEKTVEGARRDDFKEIKGIEDRLQGLDKLMYDAKKIVTEQTELALAFQQNQSRAANLGDQSILPDLCASHKNQLLVLLKNHKKLRDIRIRCGKSKDELGKNLNQRLKFVILIENKMYDIDSRLLFYHTCLRRLQKHLGIIEQVHQAPCVYVQAVTEVVRRRIFSTAFLMVNKNF
jgi:RB1-inducible coiled-coil protein 1